MADDRHAAILDALATSGGREMAPCVRAFSHALFSLAAKYPGLDPEEAVYLALKDIRERAPHWPGCTLPALIWVLAIAKRRYTQLLQGEAQGAKKHSESR